MHETIVVVDFIDRALQVIIAMYLGSLAGAEVIGRINGLPGEGKRLHETTVTYISDIIKNRRKGRK